MIQASRTTKNKAQYSPENAKTTNASLDFFKEAYKYKGKIVIASKNGVTTPALEAVFLNRVLFFKFLSTHSPSLFSAFDFPSQISPQHYFRDSINPLFREWFPEVLTQELAINSGNLYELVELMAEYSWSLLQGESAVHPWILGYIYERWINQAESGAYFTPDQLASNIVGVALEQWLEAQYENDFEERLSFHSLFRIKDSQKLPYSAQIRKWIDRKLEHVRIVDTSVGGGAFLAASARHLADLRTRLATHASASLGLQRIFASIFQTNLHGYDITPQSIIVAKLRLWLVAIEYNQPPSLPLPALPNLQTANALSLYNSPPKAVQLRLFQEQRAHLREIQSQCSTNNQESFDIYVGNPPYIALSQKSKVTNKVSLVKQWNEMHPEYAVTPTIDLSNFFILQGTDHLNPNGVLAFITSRNFFDTRYGDPIRRYLTEQVDLQSLITLHDHPFTQEGIKVKANTVILALVKRPPRNTLTFQHLTFWDEPLERASGKPVLRTSLQSSSNWTNTLFDHPIRSELQARGTHTIGEYARVKMGVKSGCNSFFLIRTDSESYAQIQKAGDALVPVAKNSRSIDGFVLPPTTQYRLLNLYEEIQGLDGAQNGGHLASPLASYIYKNGIQYHCAECQTRMEHEHLFHPEKFPHRGMCDHCKVCQEYTPCDRPIDRLSTQGHLPAWYTLSLAPAPLIAVQSIVDTEIGVFLNQNRVFVTDQFQVIDAPADEAVGELLFLYLNSRVSHFLLEGIGLHRARFDGSFMLKLQVEHIRNLPCPDIGAITPHQKIRLTALKENLILLTDRKSEAAQILRDELDEIFLEMLGYTKDEAREIQPELRKALEQAILFRWVKTRTRIAIRGAEHKGN